MYIERESIYIYMYIEGERNNIMIMFPGSSKCVFGKYDSLFMLDASEMMQHICMCVCVYIYI